MKRYIMKAYVCDDGFNDCRKGTFKKEFSKTFFDVSEEDMVSIKVDAEREDFLKKATRLLAVKDILGDGCLDFLKLHPLVLKVVEFVMDKSMATYLDNLVISFEEIDMYMPEPDISWWLDGNVFKFEVRLRNCTPYEAVKLAKMMTNAQNHSDAKLWWFKDVKGIDVDATERLSLFVEPEVSYDAKQKEAFYASVKAMRETIRPC
jgi:hypothetical protein